MRGIMQELTKVLDQHPLFWNSTKLVITAVVTTIVVIFLLRFEKKVARKLLDKKRNINLRFVESIIRFVVILLAVEFVVMSSPLTQTFGKVLFQGTTVLAAIAGFAAQPVIADIICGLMMSATRPFDLGDRIEMEDGTAGIVKDITLRHVVLQGIDTQKFIVPNSKLNGMKITNLSYETRTRSIPFRFNVAYDTDVDQAMAVIRRAVEDSPYTVAGKPVGEGYEYGPVYFIEYAASSLVMATTVYYEPKNPTEVVKSDINCRVRRALNKSGIEIPYDYVNVVMNTGDAAQPRDADGR